MQHYEKHDHKKNQYVETVMVTNAGISSQGQHHRRIASTVHSKDGCAEARTIQRAGAKRVIRQHVRMCSPSMARIGGCDE
jgi:hypothetical protein